VNREYLLNYGGVGDFGRFRPVRPLTCRRGDRVVVRSHRGLELGVVLCEAREGHAQFLPNTTVGQLLRQAGPEDEEAVARMMARGQQIFAAGRRLAAELELPVEIVDVEVLLDGEQAILHYLSWEEFDPRDLVSTLSREHDVRIVLHSLAAKAEEHGCGRPDCGQTEGGGGCGTCGSGGGCSTCGVAKPDDVQAYFTGLREEMHRERTPLL